MGSEMVHGEWIEVVRRILQSVNDQDFTAALSDLDPHAELDWSGSEAPDSGVYRGHAGWVEWMSGRHDGLSEVRFEITEVIDAPPDRLLTVVTVHSRGRASGIETVSRGAAVWKLRGMKVARLTLYQSRADALRAVGMEE